DKEHRRMMTYDRGTQPTDRRAGGTRDPLPPGRPFTMTTKGTALTDAQQAAVAHTVGPLLIIAGAGTGKTRVLVERYRRLRQEGVPAERIVPLTLTETAA